MTVTDSGFVLRQAGGITYWTHAAAERMGYTLFFLTRQGGTSLAPYSGLNLSFKVGDDPSRVERNRNQVEEVLHFVAPGPVVCDQVHGKHIHQVLPEDAGRGWRQSQPPISACDGLLTRVANLPLTITTADCLPIFLFSNSVRCALALHAGWRGVFDRFIPEAIQWARQQHAVAPETWHAAIGPSIGPESFTVDGDVLRGFRAHYPWAVHDGQYQSARVDLWHIARQQLLEVGVLAEHIYVLGEDTVLNPELYFSHRRDRVLTGRMLSFLCIN
jgi:hypothetical protein